MIRKDKIVDFFTWEHKGTTYKVAGERAEGSPVEFSVYRGKEKLDDSSLLIEFIKELQDPRLKKRFSEK